MTDNPMTGTSMTSHFALWSRIGHELRQPIQSVLLLTHLMSGMETAIQRQHTGRCMEDALLALQDMLDNVAMLAGLEAGLEIAKRAPCAMPDLIVRVAKQLAELLAEQSVTLNTKCPPATVTTDCRLLEMAVTGLVLNAMKFRTGDRVDVGCHRRRDAYRVEITFSGPAPSPAQQAALFIEIQRQQDGGATSRPVAGLAFLSRVAQHLGGVLEHKALPKGRQSLAIALAQPDGGGS